MSLLPQSLNLNVNPDSSSDLELLTSESELKCLVLPVSKCGSVDPSPGSLGIHHQDPRQRPVRGDGEQMDGGDLATWIPCF